MMDMIVTFFEQNASLFIKFGVAFLFILAGFLLRRLYRKRVSPAVRKKAEAKNHRALAILLKGFERPVGHFLALSGIYLAFLSLPIGEWAAFLPGLFYKAFRIACILLAGWGLAASSDLTALLLGGVSKKLDRATDQTVTRFLSRLFRVLVCVFFTMIAVSELGFNVTGLLTGLGLGGLTFALAAQDSAANFFGGIVILFDRPFSIGDWICCGAIEGQVEDISFRSTQIRTFQNTLTIVPNSKLSSEAITNWTRLRMRQLKFTLTLRQDAEPENLRGFLEDLRALLKKREDVYPETVQVHFHEFGESSFDVYVLCFAKTVELNASLHIREEINFQILSLLRERKLGFAYPTRTVLTELS